MDLEYVDKVIAGDSNGFRYFINKYKDMAIHLAFSILKDEFYAQDAVQEAFVKAYRNLNKFKRDSTFKTWFYRIVINESFMRLKKIKKEHAIFVKTDESTVENIPARAENREEAELIRNALNKLPAKECLALNLFYLEGYKLKEIGQLTGWSGSNTKVLLYRGRNNLRTLLYDSGLYKIYDE